MFDIAAYITLLYFFSEWLRRDVTHGSQHGDSSMLQFCLTTSLEVLDAPVSCEPGGVPKSRRSLRIQFIIQACVLLCSKIFTCLLLFKTIFYHLFDETPRRIQEESSCVTSMLTVPAWTPNSFSKALSVTWQGQETITHHSRFCSDWIQIARTDSPNSY